MLVVGAHASAGDIVRELATYDLSQDKPPKRQIYMSIRGNPPAEATQNPPEWAKRVQTVAEIVRVDRSKIHLKDGSTLEDVDVIMFTTGYLYNYPFCDPTKVPWRDHPLTRPVSGAEEGQDRPPADMVREGLPVPGGQRVRNLDQADIFYVPDRTMSFIALRESPHTLPRHAAGTDTALSSA